MSRAMGSHRKFEVGACYDLTCFFFFKDHHLGCSVNYCRGRNGCRETRKTATAVVQQSDGLGRGRGHGNK